MKRSLIGGITVAIVGAIVGAMTYVLIQWEVAENQKRDALCGEAQQSLKGVEIRARALAAGLSLDAYDKDDKDDKDDKAKVAALVNALDAATNEAEVNAVIEAQATAIDAEVDTRGDQLFLEQRLMKQRIPADVKQELQRAAKAASVACG